MKAVSWRGKSEPGITVVGAILQDLVEIGGWVTFLFTKALRRTAGLREHWTMARGYHPGSSTVSYMLWRR